MLQYGKKFQYWTLVYNDKNFFFELAMIQAVKIQDWLIPCF